MSKNNYEFYNKHGECISMSKWCEESSNPHAFRKETTVNGIRVLTKWAGVDMPEYSWLSARQFNMKDWKPSSVPKIFVSYAWNEDSEIVKSCRYAKIELAYAGHANLVHEMELNDYGVYHIPVTQLEEVNG
jgi:hypothetical protein